MMTRTLLNGSAGWLLLIYTSSSASIACTAFVTTCSHPCFAPRRPVSSSSSSSFSSSSPTRATTTTTRLYDIHAWRDLEFDDTIVSDDVFLQDETSSQLPPRNICLLPFPYHQVLLQGETKQLRLYEDRFLKLFDDCMDHHGGVVGMALLADSGGIIQTIPLCEVEAFQRMEGFGIFVTIRVVGRAKLLFLTTEEEPYLKAVCTELVDELPPNLELPNLVASQIENYMLLLSSMEHRFKQATEEQQQEGGVSEAEGGEEDEIMQRRINVAKLEDRFYQNDDDDEDDEDSDEVRELDRRGRFRQAYQVAMSTDTQGYTVAPQNQTERTAQELSAISWAAFETSPLPEEDATYRIQALDCEKLLDRLKLASIMLEEQKAELQKKMTQAGLKFRGEDNAGGMDDDSSS